MWQLLQIRQQFCQLLKTLELLHKLPSQTSLYKNSFNCNLQLNQTKGKGFSE